MKNLKPEIKRIEIKRLGCHCEAKPVAISLRLLRQSSRFYRDSFLAMTKKVLRRSLEVKHLIMRFFARHGGLTLSIKFFLNPYFLILATGFLSLTTYHLPPITASMSGGDCKITRGQAGGVGSGFYEKDNIKLYHSFSQSSPIGVNETDNIKLFSGYLIVGGYPLQVVSMNPSNGGSGVSVSTTVKVYFDGEVSSNTVDSAVSMLAVRNKSGTKISESVPVFTQYTNEDGSIKIAPKQALQNNCRYLVTISTQLKENVDGLPLETTVQWKFTTVFSPQDDNVMVSDYDEKLKIEIPQLAFSNYFCTAISTDPIGSPIKIEPHRIQIADLKAIADEPDRKILTHYEMVPFDSEKNLISTKPAKNLYVSLPFPENQSTEGGQKTIRPQSQSASERLSRNINLYRLNEEKKLWVRLPNVSLDYENQLLRGTISYLGTFALVMDPNYDLSIAFAYPVPFSPNTDPNHKSITFTNLATRCTTKIFTISGELVNEFEETDGDGEYVWTEVKNKDGESLASGVYLYLIESKLDKKVGKLMIIK
ncbi:MAG: Ig-like domain-containing protein [Elusimicrobiota bacterium]